MSIIPIPQPTLFRPEIPPPRLRTDAVIWVERGGLTLNWAIAVDRGQLMGAAVVAQGESHGGGECWFEAALPSIQRQIEKLLDSTDGELVLHRTGSLRRYGLEAEIAAAYPRVRLADPLETGPNHAELLRVAEFGTPGVITGRVTIATDGSVSPHTGHAGFGWIGTDGSFGLGALGTTRDVCHSELSAIHNALESVRDGSRVTFLVDSTDALTSIGRLIEHGPWGTGTSVKRRRRILNAIDHECVREVEFCKVSAHSGHLLNEAADRISRLARRASEHDLPAKGVWANALRIRDETMLMLDRVAA